MPLWGLSPLARGNQHGKELLGAGLRPIPARTGQPGVIQDNGNTSWAYPRSHGATAPGFQILVMFLGLSPLARGNLATEIVVAVPDGPIPARTGQPYHPLQVKPWMRAYPRSHGATTNRFYSWFNYRGLSPLARGNPVEHVGRLKSPGPIPARTGQPCRRCGAASPLGAYPRSHGATTAKSWPTRTARGLSPLARGNLPSFDHARCNHGPIPARTGQPRPAP